jgi:O-antigen/teichoic acid export membrane protein
MEKTSLKHRTLANTAYSFMGYLWPLIFSIFVTPVIVLSLGIKDYGIYIFINTIISFLGLLDLGLSTAFTRRLAYYYGKRDEGKIRLLAGTANFLFLLTGIAGFVIMCAMGKAGPLLLPGVFSSYARYSNLFVLGGVLFLINSVSALYVIVLQAIQRFDISSKIGIVSITVSQLLMLALVIMKYSLSAIFISQILVALATSSAIFIWSLKLLPEAGTSLSFDRSEAVHAYRFGLVTLMNNASSSALTYLDRLIIPFFVGPSNLTYYTIAGSAAMKITGVSNNLATTLFPTVAQLDGEKDKETIKNLYVRSFRLITIAASALAVTLISFSYEVLSHWLTPEFAEKATTALIILTITNFILALAGPLSNFLIGLGRLKLLTIMSTVMAVMNAILLFALLPAYGINGAAWAYLLSALPIGYVMYFTEKHYLHLEKRKKYYAHLLLSTIVTAAIVSAVDVFLLRHLISDFSSLIAVGATSGALYVILYRVFGFFDAEDWRDLESFFDSVKGKLLLRKG